MQVLRYSALIFGVFYGFLHQRTLNAEAREAHAKQEYKHKESLIQQAKMEWAKKSMPPSAKPDGTSIITIIRSRQDGVMISGNPWAIADKY